MGGLDGARGGGVELRRCHDWRRGVINGGRHWVRAGGSVGVDRVPALIPFRRPWEAVGVRAEAMRHS